MFRDSQGAESLGTLVHLTPALAVFEVYGPRPIVHPREVLRGVRILRSGKPVYMGTVEVSGIAPTGPASIVSANLVDPWDHPVEEPPTEAVGQRFNDEARAFITQWESFGRLLPEYQLAVGNARDFLLQMSRWLASLDVSVEGSENAQETRETVRALEAVLYPKLKELFGAFEAAAARVPVDRVTQHIALARRELHPLMLCSPFIHRTFTKPLGYAGDYEMVNMITRDIFEGPSAYAQVLNAMILRSGGAQAHRNRIERLAGYLDREARRVTTLGRDLRVLNIGCGPAGEIQRFVRTNPLADHCHFQLMDFNAETLEYARGAIAQSAAESCRTPTVTFIQKSINELLKDAARGATGRNGVPALSADLVYCAGLFDYLSDKVSARLLQLLHRWVSPGGLVVATNVHPRNDVRYFLDHLLDWNLIYRDEQHMESLAPEGADCVVETDPTGLNVFLEICKPATSNGAAVVATSVADPDRPDHPI
jgi:extracellular factor (EF) 3-hydroxypalmitic acid methyl ester biosynthesis protein